MTKTRYFAAMGLCLAAWLAPLGASAQGLAGPYLAAIQADIRNDYEAAARFYPQALVADPKNLVLLRGTLASFIAKGDVNSAVTIAQRIADVSPDDQFAGLVLAANAVRSGDFALTEALIENENLRLNNLLRGLLLGWAKMAQGKADAAVEQFDALDQNPSLATLAQYNKALALATVGDFEAANEIMTGGEDGPLRIDRVSLIAHLQILAQIDMRDEAIAYIDATLNDQVTDAEISELREALASGADVPFDVVEGPEDGIAGVILTLAGALGREDDPRIALIYARLAEFIDPDLDEALLLAADMLAGQGQNDLAIDAYSRVSVDSPLFLDAEIGRAEALRASDRLDAAIEVLSGLSRSYPDRLSVHMALGDALRSDERYEEAAPAYGAAIDLIENPAAGHWVLFYSRGISYERTGQWDKAEADFRFALELFPDQPLVLNYLGYSLVELRRNLAEAQKMIETAVAARPDDGYITDSLGWVLYRLGKFEEAVEPMERSVELVPTDPIINDHLGDVLWMVGRKREAEFQWKRALSFKPEEEDADRIRRKLDVGLDQVLANEAAEKTSHNTDE